VKSGPSLLVQSPPNDVDLDRYVDNYMGSFEGNVLPGTSSSGFLFS
jgi:hypothetical protein